MLYFSHKINREIKEIYWQTFLSNFALALVFIFEPIYLYTLSHSLIYVLWFYVQVYAWYVVLIFWGAKFAGKFGYKHSILLSNIFYIVYWITLYFIGGNSVLFYIAPIFFALQKSFFWPAFDADVAMHDGKNQRGREIGVLFSTQQLAFIIGPFFGGVVLAKLGFLSLFILASIVMFVSVIPLFQSPDIFDRHNFRFKNLWQVFKLHKQNFFGYWGFAEDLMLMSLWPVFMYLIVGQFAGVGTLTAVAMLIAVVLMLYIGKRSDLAKKQRLIEVNSIFYGLTWVFRFVATGVPLVLLFDVLTKTFKSLVAVPMTALTYELAGDKGPDHAIAYSVFYEFSLSIGKVVTALLGIWILSLTGNIYLVFGFVGVLTMFYGLLK
jgi:MFS family permease